ncbi:MAG: glycine cleavage system protein GcvH [Nitriliruptoraceae bacterium]
MHPPVPPDLHYTAEHEWIRVEGDVVRVGITAYAQDQLGDIVYVDLPDEGAALERGQSFGEIESTKSVSDLYAPVSGSIVARNAALDEAPERINSDPYGDGWIVTIAPSHPEQIDDLLDATTYEGLLA